jgi:hypothetical protein
MEYFSQSLQRVRPDVKVEALHRGEKKRPAL